MTLKDSIIRSSVLILLAGVTVSLCKAFPNAANDPRAGMVLELPKYLVGHHVVEMEISEEEKIWLPSDTLIKKLAYVPRDALTREEAWRDAIRATLILSGADQRSLHRPEVCLDAQGWTIQEREVVPLAIGDKTLEVMDLHLVRLDKQGDGTLKRTRAHYLYWWIGHERTTPSTLWRALYSFWDNLMFNRNSRWGYPSVMTTVSEELGDRGREQAQRRAYDFVREYAPMFQKSLGAGAE